MPLPYAVFVQHELYEVIRTMRQPWRNKVVQFIESLAGNPFDAGDYSERDPADRFIQVKVVGPWAIFFWADHAVSEVKVVQIVLSDR